MKTRIESKNMVIDTETLLIYHVAEANSQKQVEPIHLSQLTSEWVHSLPREEREMLADVQAQHQKRIQNVKDGISKNIPVLRWEYNLKESPSESAVYDEIVEGVQDAINYGHHSDQFLTEALKNANEMEMKNRLLVTNNETNEVIAEFITSNSDSVKTIKKLMLLAENLTSSKEILLTLCWALENLSNDAKQTTTYKEAKEASRSPYYTLTLNRLESIINKIDTEIFDAIVLKTQPNGKKDSVDNILKAMIQYRCLLISDHTGRVGFRNGTIWYDIGKFKKGISLETQQQLIAVANRMIYPKTPASKILVSSCVYLTKFS